MLKSFAERTHEKMKEVLMSPEASGPEIHYYMIRGGSNKTNITVWESGKIDGEYIKAYGHYHVGSLEETYIVLEGRGILLMQERAVDTDGHPIDDCIKSFRALSIKRGDIIHIPKNTGHLVVNTGDTWLVTSDDSPVNFNEKDPVSLPGHADYEPFRKLHGAAYYVVEKNGHPELVRNPNYKSVPKAKIQKARWF